MRKLAILWSKPRNRILPCAFRSNHDISFIASTSRMLASLDYMSNYATKDDVKLHQLVMTAILKVSLETTTRHASFRLCHATNFARSERYDKCCYDFLLPRWQSCILYAQREISLDLFCVPEQASAAGLLSINQSINQSIQGPLGLIGWIFWNLWIELELD